MKFDKTVMIVGARGKIVIVDCVVIVAHAVCVTRQDDQAVQTHIPRCGCMRLG